VLYSGIEFRAFVTGGYAHWMEPRIVMCFCNLCRWG